MGSYRLFSKILCSPIQITIILNICVALNVKQTKKMLSHARLNCAMPFFLYFFLNKAKKTNESAQKLSCYNKKCPFEHVMCVPSLDPRSNTTV